VDSLVPGFAIAIRILSQQLHRLDSAGAQTRRQRTHLLAFLDFPAYGKHTANIGPHWTRPGFLLPMTPDSTASRISMTLSSSLESVDRLEHTAEDVAERAGFDEDTVPHIGMAVREAAINAVLHGNSYNAGKQIVASFETTAADFIFRISDQGAGFDPTGLTDPLAPENILRGSGRGIFLIRAFMDEVHFRQLHPGTEITLIKHRAPGQPVT